VIGTGGGLGPGRAPGGGLGRAPGGGRRAGLWPGGGPGQVQGSTGLRWWMRTRDAGGGGVAAV